MEFGFLGIGLGRGADVEPRGAAAAAGGQPAAGRPAAALERQAAAIHAALGAQEGRQEAPPEEEGQRLLR